MPELSRFYGIIIKMYFNDTQQHHKPHIHAFYGEVNGIAYASEKSNKISITDAKVTDHLMMIVTFSGGEKRVFDASVLTGSAFKPLEDDAIFSNFKIMHGVITWMNDEIDCAPEYIYEHSFEYEDNTSPIAM